MRLLRFTASVPGTAHNLDISARYVDQQALSLVRIDEFHLVLTDETTIDTCRVIDDHTSGLLIQS
jgi:hypothetical protein